MKSVDSIVSKVEVLNSKNISQHIDYQVKKFYQSDGHWYAVIQMWVNGSLTAMHVALD